MQAPADVQWIGVSSSTVLSVGYWVDENGTGWLGVLFRRRGKPPQGYAYQGVDHTLYEAFLASSSKGTFVESVIKPMGKPVYPLD